VLPVAGVARLMRRPRDIPRAAGWPALALVLLGTMVGRPALAASTPVSVFAAASLADAFRDLGRVFQARHPQWQVQLNLAGSQQLAMQIQQGARADVFASANQHWTTVLQQAHLLAGAPRDFAGNLLVVIVPTANPGRIVRLQDLARPGIKLVLGVQAVPVGHYSRALLAKLGAAPGFGADYGARVLRNVVSDEEDVKAVVGKVQLGEADAGIVYRSDVTPQVAAAVRQIDVPAAYNVLAAYSVCVPKDAPHPAAARALIGLLLSPGGQAVLRAHGLLPLGAKR
jgi:molybdate transport system substrate-binding protein